MWKTRRMVLSLLFMAIPYISPIYGTLGAYSQCDRNLAARLADYSAWNLTMIRMEQVSNNPKISEAEKVAFNTIRIFTKGANIDNPPDRVTMQEAIGGRWKQTLKKIYNPVIRYIDPTNDNSANLLDKGATTEDRIEQLLEDSNETIEKIWTEFSFNSDRVDSLKRNIGHYIDQCLERRKEKPKDSPAETDPARDIDLMRSRDTDSNWPTTLSYVVGGVLIIAVVGLFGILLRFSFRKIKTVWGKIASKVGSLETHRKDYKEEFEQSVKEKLGQLEKAIEQLKNEPNKGMSYHRSVSPSLETATAFNDGKISKMRPNHPSAGNAKIDVPRDAPPKEVFYLPVAMGKLLFDDRQKSESVRYGISVFQFAILDETGFRAQFSFIDDRSVKRRALNTPELYIDPVCESENSLKPHKSSFVTVEEGIAEKRGDRWEVTQKSKIQYE